VSVAFLIMHCPAFPGRADTALAVGHALSRDLGPVVEREPWENHPSMWSMRVDPGKSGAWSTARRCWEAGLEMGRDFIVLLNDDALLPVGFVQAATDALEAANARSPRDPVCFYTAHPKAEEAAKNGLAWYTTPDGLVGVGCGMHRENVKEFLAWHDANFVGDHTDDGRINLWAMATGRRIFTTLPSLVGHQLPDESTVGNTHHDYRQPAVPPPDDVTGLFRHRWTDSPIARFGRQYLGNHWRLLTNVQPHAWKAGGLVEKAYDLERQR
jgi:hypothetical protein